MTERSKFVIPVLLFLVVVVGQFLAFLAPVPSVASMRAVVPACLLVLVLWSHRVWAPAGVPRPLFFTLLALVLWLFMGAFFGVANYAAALSRFSEVAILVIAGLVTWRLLDAGVVSANTLWKFFFCSAVPVLALILVIWFGSPAPRNHNWVWQVSPFFNIRHIGFVLVPAWAAANYFLLLSERKALSWAMLFVLMALAVWSGGRGQVVAMCITSVFLLVFLADYRKKAAVLFFVSAPLAVIVAAFFAVRQSAMGLFRAAPGVDGNADTATSGRLSAWQEVFSDCIDSPLFCYGPDGYRFVTSERLETVHPHNFVVQLISEWGFPGLFLVLLSGLIGLYALLTVWKSRQSAGLAPLVITVAAWASYMALGLVDGVFYHAYPLAALMVLSAMLAYELGKWPSPLTFPAVEFIRLGNMFTYITISLAGLVLFVHYSVVLVDRPMKQPPQADSVQGEMLRLFPSSTFATEQWIGRWAQTDPGRARAWNDWLLKVAPRPWSLYVREARWAEEQGDMTRALEYYRKAERFMPRNGNGQYEALQEKIRTLDSSVNSPNQGAATDQSP